MRKSGNKILKRYVFRSKRANRPKSITRQLIEIVMLFSCSSILFYYLNSIPNNQDVNDVLLTSLDSLFNGLSLVFSALVTFFSFFLVIALLSLSILLMAGALWRVVRLASLLIKKSGRS